VSIGTPFDTRKRAFGIAALSPATTLTASSGRPPPSQGPSTAARSSARGPITATVRSPSRSGRTRPPPATLSFCSSTIAFRAASRAAARCSGVSAADFSRVVSLYRYGSVNSPSAYLRRSVRCTAVSTVAWRTRPSRTATASVSR
jgi:hypothetical protein